jgi:hypothetical protein
MPQGKRKYDDIDQVLGLPSSPTGKYEDIDQVLGLKPQQQPQQPPGFLENLGIGARRALLNVADAGRVMEEAIGAAVKGDFTPIKQIGELVGRGAISMGNSIAAGPYQAGPAYISSQIEQAPRVAQIHEQQSERMAQDPSLYSQEAIAEHQRLDALAGQDPSLTGKLTRGASQFATELVPAAITGATTGGSGAAIAGLTALQSMGQPENLALNVGLASTLPVVGRGVGKGVRALGGGLEQGLESEVPEALQGATSQIRATGPVDEMNSIRAKAGLPSLSGEGAPPPLGGLESVPTLSPAEGRASASIQGPPVSGADLNLQTQTPTEEWSGSGKILGKVLEVPNMIMRTFRTAYDLSAPLAQGMFMFRAHPALSVKAFGTMLRSLSPEQSQMIDDAILSHPLRQLGEDFGLHVSTWGEPEEAFMLRLLNKVPGIGGSERTYRTFLDTQRLSVWDSYVKSLLSDGYTPQDNPTAFRQAAAFINIGTGRGDIGPKGMLAGAVKLGNQFLFAPRNLISKWQLLDPTRYMTLAPGARKLVLRDAMTSFGSMLGTAVILNQAGVGTSLNPFDDDFMSVRWGNTRYDLSGGLKTEVKFLAKLIRGVFNEATGEGNLPHEDPISVAGHYARGKLAPLWGFGMDVGTGRDYTGQRMADKSATQIAIDSFGPMVVQDLYDGYQDSGWEGMAKSLPTIIGQRVSTYKDKPKADWISTPQDFRLEQRRLGVARSFLEPKRSKDKDIPDESVDEFSSRKALADQWMQQYGKALVNSNEYWVGGTDDQRKAALDLFKKRVVTQSSKEGDEQDLGGLIPEVIMADVREQEENKAERKEERKRAIKPQKPSPPVLPSRQ